MNPSRAESIGQQLAEHEVRIDTLEKGGVRVEDKLDRLLWWIIGVLLASVATLGGIVFKR